MPSTTHVDNDSDVCHLILNIRSTFIGPGHEVLKPVRVFFPEAILEGPRKSSSGAVCATQVSKDIRIIMRRAGFLGASALYREVSLLKEGRRTFSKPICVQKRIMIQQDSTVEQLFLDFFYRFEWHLHWSKNPCMGASQSICAQ
jgi:hypothetical protein